MDGLVRINGTNPAVSRQSRRVRRTTYVSSRSALTLSVAEYSPTTGTPRSAGRIMKPPLVAQPLGLGAPRANSSAVRAPVLHTGGRRFDPCFAHHPSAPKVDERAISWVPAARVAVFLLRIAYVWLTHPRALACHPLDCACTCLPAHKCAYLHACKRSIRACSSAF